MTKLLCGCPKASPLQHDDEREAGIRLRHRSPGSDDMVWHDRSRRSIHAILHGSRPVSVGRRIGEWRDELQHRDEDDDGSFAFSLLSVVEVEGMDG